MDIENWKVSKARLKIAPPDPLINSPFIKASGLTDVKIMAGYIPEIMPIDSTPNIDHAQTIGVFNSAIWIFTIVKRLNWGIAP